MDIRSKYIYPLFIAFILCWWVAAFHRPDAYEAPYTPAPACYETELTSQVSKSYLPKLMHIDRAQLKMALDGDVAMIGQLMTDWDIEAEIAEKEHAITLKRLNREDFLKAQLLIKTLTTVDSTTLSLLREDYRVPLLIDNKKLPFDLTNPPESFLPQTYLSTDILLALIEPSRLVALPGGMREQTSLYPKSITDRVPHDIDSIHTEQLYIRKPDIALVSETYSHPLILQALDNHQIPKFILPDVYSFEEIETLFITLGQLCNRPLKGELMALFLKAAVIAIDNARMLKIGSTPLNRTLVLDYHTKFSLPGRKTVTRHMMDRIGITYSADLGENNEDNPWAIPLTEEKIIHYNPQSLLIITTSESESALNYFYQTTLFHHIEAANNHRISVLDAFTQQTVSQYAILAYYDLNKALVEVYEQ